MAAAEGELTVSQSRPDLVEDTRRLLKGDSHTDDTEWKDQYKAINEELLKEKLIQATKYKDKVLLEKSIKDYYDSGLVKEGNTVLENAGKQLDIIRTKEALIEATKKRDITDIKLLLRSIEENETESKKKKGKSWRKEDGYVHHLLFEMTEGKKVLRVVESGRDKNRKILPTTLKMDRNTMSEIKRYSTPPVGLHQVMQAVFLLLGIDEEITEEWSTCTKLANPDGRQGLNRRVQALDVSNIDPEICARAKEILAHFQYKQLLRASAGAATFYSWAMGTISKYTETDSLEGVVPAVTERQIELLRPQDLQDRKNEYPMFTPRINKPRGKASLKPNEQFERNLRAPHSGGRAKDSLVEPKQYSKSDF